MIHNINQVSQPLIWLIEAIHQSMKSLKEISVGYNSTESLILIHPAEQLDVKEEENFTNFPYSLKFFQSIWRKIEWEAILKIRA